MFHGRISLVWILFQLLPSFVKESMLELMNIPLINISSSQIQLHHFWLLVQLPQLIKMILFICTDRTNNWCQRPSSDRLVIISKAFLNLPNFFMLIKQQKHLLSSGNLVLMNFDKLIVTFSAKLNLQSLLYLMVVSCYHLHVIRQKCLLKSLRTLL